jgi:hypothetical protein
VRALLVWFRRGRTLALLFACVVVGPTAATASPTSRSSGRPPDTPDLAAMALGKADFGLGARVASAHWVDEPGALAAFERHLVGALSSQASLLLAVNEVSYFENVRSAAHWADEFAAGFRSAAFRKALAKGLQALAAETHVRTGQAPKVTIDRVRPLGLGAHSFELAATVRAADTSLSFAFAVFNTDRVASFFLGISMPRRPLSFGAVAHMNQLVAARIPAGLTPTNTTPPSISGLPQSGKPLTLHAGLWTNEPTNFGYQWLRCDANGGACASIGSATAASYVVTDADVGSALRGQVIVSNSSSRSQPVQTGQTPVVAAAGLPSPPALPSPVKIIQVAICPKTDIVEDEGVWACKKDWSGAELPPIGAVYCTSQVLDAVGLPVTVEFFSEAGLDKTWTGRTINDPHWYVWSWWNARSGHDACRVSVGGDVVEVPFVVGGH